MIMPLYLCSVAHREGIYADIIKINNVDQSKSSSKAQDSTMKPEPWTMKLQGVVARAVDGSDSADWA